MFYMSCESCYIFIKDVSDIKIFISYLISQEKKQEEPGMSYKLSNREVDQILGALKESYDVYAPKRFPKQGRYSDTDILHYHPVGLKEEIEWKEKSDYPAKEIINPIQQALFFYTEDEYRASKTGKKPILVFARPCDINAQKVQARIYAGNGDFTDMYYKRVRDRLKFIMMECNGGDDTCFCVSMGSNTVDREDYAAAVRFTDDGMYVDVVDPELEKYFEGMTETEYEPEFVMENELKVQIPDLEDKEVRKALKKHPMWQEYNSRCISCGACTVACSTCSCFTTRDIAYGDNPEVGERRRVNASCQVAGFDQMAGQREFRPTAADRMRYKVLHKFYDYKARFGDRHMCVGCGRCTHRCPELITITGTVGKINAAVEEIKAQMANA